MGWTGDREYSLIFEMQQVTNVGKQTAITGYTGYVASRGRRKKEGENERRRTPLTNKKIAVITDTQNTKLLSR